MFQKYKIPFSIALFLIISYLIIFPDVRYNEYFTDEDSWVENFSALCFLLASLLFFRTYWLSKGNGLRIGKIQTPRNLIFLGLGILFFVAFGEEISWGQRIFGWATPESMAEVNYQQETNLHNLDFFTFKSETGDGLMASLLVFNAGRIFFYFWFTYLLLIPLSNKYHSACRDFFKSVNFPVPQIWLGLLMLFNLILSKLYKVATSGLAQNHNNSIDEVMEGNYALVIAVLAISFAVPKVGLKRAASF